jgi:hypothetical protein
MGDEAVRASVAGKNEQDVRLERSLVPGFTNYENRRHATIALSIGAGEVTDHPRAAV